MEKKAPDKSVYEPSEVVDIVREWFLSYSEKDFDAHNALIHPDAVVVYPEMCFVAPGHVRGQGIPRKDVAEGRGELH
jgi:ketosteroid isomerase-like protein